MDQAKENHIIFLSNIKQIFYEYFGLIEEIKNRVMQNIESVEALHRRKWDSLEEQVNAVWADALELQADMKDLCEDEEFDGDCVVRNYHWKMYYTKLRDILGYMQEMEEFKRIYLKTCTCYKCPVHSV